VSDARKATLDELARLSQELGLDEAWLEVCLAQRDEARAELDHYRQALEIITTLLNDNPDASTS